MSVGTMSAIGGQYVPVNDAAVTLNTGTLVYKECVLREILDRMREGAMSGLFKQIYTAIQSGRSGNPMYVQKVGDELLAASDKEKLQFLKGSVKALNPAFVNEVRSQLARSYMIQTRNPEQNLVCPMQGDLRAMLTSPNQPFDFAARRSGLIRPIGCLFAGESRR